MEIYQNFEVCKLNDDEKRCIYELILERYPYRILKKPRLELKQFMESYIIPLSITDYVVVKNIQSTREGVKVIIKTLDKIGCLDIYNNPDKEDSLQYRIKMFPTCNITDIDVASVEINGITYNGLLIGLTNKNILDAIMIEYLPTDKEANNFVSNLLNGVN